MEKHLQLPSEVTRVTSTHLSLFYINCMSTFNFKEVEKYTLLMYLEAEENQKYWQEAIKTTTMF